MVKPSRAFRSTYARLEAIITNTTERSTRLSFGPRLYGLVRVSSALSAFLGGVPQASRSYAALKISEHIKRNYLLSPLNRREINCDDKLKTIFGGKDKVAFTEIAELLNPHFVEANKR